jgi:hypothetical protein
MRHAWAEATKSVEDEHIVIDVGVGVPQGIGQTLLLLAIGHDREITLDEAMKLVEENDGSVILVVGEEVLSGLPEVTGTHVAIVVGLDDVQVVTRDEAMHGGDHDKVVLDPGWVGRSCSERAVDVVEETMAAKDGVEVDVPLKEVVGVKVEDDWRRRAHRGGKGDSTADNGDGVGGHVGQRKTGATTV